MRKAVIVILLVLGILITLSTVNAFSQLSEGPIVEKTETLDISVGLSIGEFYELLSSGAIPDEVTVHGTVAEVQQVESYTYVRIVEENRELWIAISKAEVPIGTNIVVTGMILVDFPSASLGKTFDIVIFADYATSYEKTPTSTNSPTIATPSNTPTQSDPELERLKQENEKLRLEAETTKLEQEESKGICGPTSILLIAVLSGLGVNAWGKRKIKI